MQIHRNIPPPLNSSDRANVIDMRVRNPDRIELCPVRSTSAISDLPSASRIDNCRRVTVRIGDEVAVLLKGPVTKARDDHAEYPPVPIISEPQPRFEATSDISRLRLRL